MHRNNCRVIWLERGAACGASAPLDTVFAGFLLRLRPKVSESCLSPAVRAPGSTGACKDVVLDLGHRGIADKWIVYGSYVANTHVRCDSTRAVL